MYPQQYPLLHDRPAEEKTKVFKGLSIPEKEIDAIDDTLAFCMNICSKICDSKLAKCVERLMDMRIAELCRPELAPVLE